MHPLERAEAYHNQGFNCAQSTCAGFCNRFAVDEKTVLMMASPFGGGIGHMGDTCGAVTGGLMVLGLKYGMSEPGDVETKARAYKLSQEFIRRFRKRNHSIACRELVGHDLSTPEGEAVFKEEHLGKTVCPPIISSAIEILQDMFEEKKDRSG